MKCSLSFRHFPTDAIRQSSVDCLKAKGSSISFTASLHASLYTDYPIPQTQPPSCPWSDHLAMEYPVSRYHPRSVDAAVNAKRQRPAELRPEFPRLRQRAAPTWGLYANFAPENGSKSDTALRGYEGPMVNPEISTYDRGYV
jgi:hypothetical protein